ncbi:UbiH 2-polyprenyl-6-methoxyphenol hydroxylase [Pyrenophora tritici-repentis]|uniref:FAD binding domain containing protein n=1 Tax=Pyrenophora tritici-repentis TaxID=45151 RepID=A0A2W1D1U7_9PLEO|nr:UbiH 2-polyprenyl-6-methoxyphenol hydroxylase and related FAD-dependent oxidoreductase [Pyrenophora tritici-repentis]KAF7444010.1 UbiH 2-polyprenyl-6-methoxyphenol hydroxylase [Pyrenophora tritici-repentis]KAF7566257.1 UbiH, 2-polyprenyl-6-methoxyphenol hydroxylase and related FAD-dependent oxidoreductase [Pyrenophora tritici-repentis]KAG9379747.1 UbiH 2-polyprenyl-6-methoxyphenol hydroxylase [Pyrenophora tritici-repentis]KAI0571565.1 UbiH 2-polyprenyl-6-methoxyphenol hydroxylase and related
MAEAQSKRIVVGGGSIAGLMHALVLKSHGYNVDVLEVRSKEQLQAQAAGLSLWPNAQKVLTTYIPEVELNDVVFRNPSFPIFDNKGEMVVEVPCTEDVRTSCWAGIHRLLWTACENRKEGHGLVTMRCGTTVSGLTENDDHLTVAYKGEDGTEDTIPADLVIAADGARSYFRSLVLPDVKPEYVGYVAWRASIKVADAPEQLLCAIEGKMPICMLDGSYVMVYLSPGKSGNMNPEERVIEWCWYDPCDASTPVFSEYMTDVHNIRHNVTVPSHLLRSEVWAAQLRRRDSSLTPMWRQVFHQSDMPLLTAIRSFDNTKSSFFDGKLLLVGEAFLQLRPHLGASSDIAGISAMNFPHVLNGEISIEEWEKRVAEHAMEKAIGSRAMGMFGMTGQWPEPQPLTAAPEVSQEILC